MEMLTVQSPGFNVYPAESRSAGLISGGDLDTREHPRFEPSEISKLFSDSELGRVSSRRGKEAE